MKELLASIWAVVKSVPVKLQAQGCANMRKHTLNVNCPKNKIVPSELNPLDKTGKKKKGGLSFLTLFWVSSLTPPSGHCQQEHQNDSALLCLHVFAIIAYFVFASRKWGAGRRWGGCYWGPKNQAILYDFSPSQCVSHGCNFHLRFFLSRLLRLALNCTCMSQGTCTGYKVWKESSMYGALILHRCTAQRCPPIHCSQPIGCGADPCSAAVMGTSFLAVECIRLHLIGLFHFTPLTLNQEPLSLDWFVKEHRGLSFCVTKAWMRKSRAPCICVTKPSNNL